MDAEGAHIEDNPLIAVDFGDNGGEMSFTSIKDARQWIDREIRAWEEFPRGIRLGGAHQTILERQLELPKEIQSTFSEGELLEAGEHTEAVRRIRQLFGRYADYGSVCSQSDIGEAIHNLKQSGRGSVAVGVLAGALGISPAEIQKIPNLNEGALAVVLSGYAIGTTFNLVRRSDLPEHQSRMDEHLGALDELVKQAEQDREDLTGQGKAANAEVSEYVRSQREIWEEFVTFGQNEFESLKNAYEEQLRLQAPATYWSKRARITLVVASFALGLFAVGAVLLAWAVVRFGPDLLERLASIGDVGSLGMLAILSIPALTVLWVLRQLARLFVTNLEGNADAKMRETMATTYLALTNEGAGSVTDKERLMVLEALFRPPAPHRADDGHFGGALEILTRRGSDT